MPRKSKSITRDKLPMIAAAMKSRAKTPKTLNLETTICELSKEIQAMLEAGYGYEDIADLFSEHGVEIAATSIKSYHRKSKAAAAPETQTKEEQEQEDSPPRDISIPDNTKTVASEGKSSATHHSKQDKAAPDAKPEKAFNVTNRNEL